jgi:hypothetical protein
MMNDRPIENPELQQALDEVKAIMQRYDLAGACMLVSADEAAYTYGLHASWSAWRPDAQTPLGVRFRANSTADGKDVTQKRIEGGIHTICQLADFGRQTAIWMEQMKVMLRDAGFDFDHTPFAGQSLPWIGPASGPRT